MDIALLSINIVAGAFVGYITKLLAINMLFQKYPIVGGAEIIKERERLGESISTLVEERLIKPSTMLEEFQKESFKESFEVLISHIIETSIEANFKELSTINEIKGINETSNNLYKFLIENRERILDIITDILLKNVLIQDVLSPEQLKNVVAKLFEILSESLLNNLKEILDNMIKEIDNKKLFEFISKDLIEKLYKNLIPENINVILEEEFDEKIDILIDKTFNEFEFDQILNIVEKSIKDKTLANILVGIKPESANIEYFLKRLINFLNSEKGKNILDDFIIQVIDTAKTLDIPLSNILTKNLEGSLLKLIEKYLPDLLVNIENWLDYNKDEVAKLINTAIEEHLGSEGILKQVTGAIFAQKLAERYQIVEGVIKELRKTAKNSNSEILTLINRFLDNTKISDLVIFLEPKILDKKALAELILELVNNYLPKFKLTDFNVLLNKKLSEIPLIQDLELKEVFYEYLYPEIKYQLKERVLFDKNFSKLIKKVLDSNIDKLNDKSLLILIAEEDQKALKTILFDIVASNDFQKNVVNKVSEKLPDLIKDKSLSILMTDKIKKDIYDKSELLYKSKIKSILEIIKTEKVTSISKNMNIVYKKLAQDRKFSKQVTNVLVELMIKLIRDNKLLDGKIYIAIKESFKKFTDDELKAEMNSFMGKELQPIKMLGAFLGACVGIIMFYISLIPGYGQYAKGYWALLSYPFSYAVTEIGTNWMAIKMLFKPYNPIKIPNTNIVLPFTPGIFAKNKKALAESMVNFIDKKLLSKENMVKILEKYHLKWKEVIKGAVSKNDYQAITETVNNYTKENYDSISPLVLDLAFHELNKNKEEISGYLISEVKNINISKLELSTLKEEISIKIDESKSGINIFVENQLKELNLHNESKLKTILPKEAITLIDKVSLELVNYSLNELLKTLQDKKSLSEYLEKITNNLDESLDLSADLVLNSNTIEKTKTGFITFLIKQLKNKKLQDIILDYFESKILTNLSSDKTLNELFDGKLIKTLVIESDTVMDSVSNYISKLSKNRKEDLVNLIVSDIEKKGVFESVLLKFGGLKKDIRGIVDLIIDKKLVGYLDNKKDELNGLFKSYIQQIFSKLKLSELGLEEEIFNQKVIRNIIKKNLFDNEQIALIIQEIMDNLIEDILKELNLVEILSAIDIYSTKDIMKRFDKELNLVIENIAKKEKFSPEFLSAVNLFIKDLLESIIYKAEIKDILKDIKNSDVSNSLNNIINFIYSSESFKVLKINLLEELMSKVLKNIDKVVDYPILKDDLSSMINNLTEKTDVSNTSRTTNFQTGIATKAKDITIDFVEVLNSNIENETKQVVEEILVNSLVDSLRINNREILEPIDFASIVRKEVFAMEAERIESMFDFAKPIFKLLVWYGSLAGIIGLAVGIFEAFR